MLKQACMEYGTCPAGEAFLTEGMYAVVVFVRFTFFVFDILAFACSGYILHMAVQKFSADDKMMLFFLFFPENRI